MPWLRVYCELSIPPALHPTQRLDQLGIHDGARVVAIALLEQLVDAFLQSRGEGML